MNTRNVLIAIFALLIAVLVWFYFFGGGRNGSEVNDVEINVSDEDTNGSFEIQESDFALEGYTGILSGIYHTENMEFVTYPEDLYTIEISFEADRLGSTAINHIGADYATQEANIQINEIASTLIGAENIEWEMMYVQHLENVSTYELDSEVLRLYDPFGTLLLEFE